MAIVQNINNYCAVNGITIKEFERRCGLSNSVVHKWAIGKSTPTLSTLGKIVTATGIGMAEWLKDEGEHHDSSRQNSGAFC